MQDSDGGLRHLGGMQEAEGIGTIRIHHGVQVDLANAVEFADVEGIGGQQLPRSAALNMPLAEAGVGFLYLDDLLRGQLERGQRAALGA